MFTTFAYAKIEMTNIESLNKKNHSNQNFHSKKISSKLYSYHLMLGNSMNISQNDILKPEIASLV